MLETNYFIVSLFCSKESPVWKRWSPFFQRFHGVLCPRVTVPYVECQEEVEQCCHVRKSTWGTGHIFLHARKGQACPEIPAIISHLVCTSVLCSHLVVPWHPWRQLLRDIILSVSAASQHQHHVVLELNWAADWQSLCSLYLSRPANCSAPSIWSSTRHS